ncbi:hypothetical protein PC122_g4680 [Phytophthora cactorum]|nr:hypothetical protein PC122_g4680 [Phytophthora cactorum]
MLDARDNAEGGVGPLGDADAGVGAGDDIEVDPAGVQVPCGFSSASLAPRQHGIGPAWGEWLQQRPSPPL